MQSDVENEFWSALLEKAYAKIHGSYEALRGGNTSEALVDFSGGCSETYDLNDIPDGLFDIMSKACQKQKSMMSCSIEPDPRILEARLDNGLIRGHAYSITKVIKVQIGQVSHQLSFLTMSARWLLDLFVVIRSRLR